MTDDVPNEVARAAEGAFGARPDGTTLLDLQAETLATLCFSDDDVTVDVFVDRKDGVVQPRHLVDAAQADRSTAWCRLAR